MHTATSVLVATLAGTTPPVELNQVNVAANGLNIVGDAANEPSIAVDPTAPNRMAIGWRQFDSIGSNFRQAGYGWSDDGGRSWHFPGVLQPGVFRSDPVLGARADGTLLYFSLKGNFTCDFWSSGDGGQTWGDPVFAFGGDKQWFTVDRTGGPGHDHVYATWSTAAGPYNSTTFMRSIDGAQTFETPIAMPEPVAWGTLAVANDGTLYIAGIKASPFDTSVIKVARSGDARFARQTPTFATSTVDLGGGLVFSAGPNPGGLTGQISIDVDPSTSAPNPVYLLASVEPSSGVDDPLDVHFVRSLDGGITWSSPVRVNDDPPGNGAWQWFGTMSVAPNGRIDVVYNDTSGSGVVAVSELRYTFSADGGTTWAPSIALSGPWNSMVGWPQQSKIGDYYHMSSDLVGADLACAMTLNGEQDVYYIRIGDRDCDGNGVGDTEDLASGALDCDGDGNPDLCEIAAGTLTDADGDGIPDLCDEAADLDNDGDVDASDLAILLGAWGTSDADLDGDGVTAGSDLALLLGAWSR